MNTFTIPPKQPQQPKHPQLLRYTAVVDELESLGIFPDKPLTLKPTQEGLQRIGYFESEFYQKGFLNDPYRILVVAGTNGKGSVCATLEALFQASGETVGLYTSPHLVDTTERIRINGQNIPHDHFCEVYESVQKKVQGLTLSHFEMLTLLAVSYFTSGLQTPPVDRIILEVGMGGTWDATNAVPHGVSVITKIGFDHERHLGHHLLQILENKLGIVPLINTPEIPHPLVIHLPFPQESTHLVGQRKKQNPHVQWLESPVYPHHVTLTRGSEPKTYLHSPWGKLPLALMGKRAAENSSLALSVFAAVQPTASVPIEALEKVQWLGRMQRFFLPNEPKIYLSGDHNPQGIESLLELLPYYPRKHLHILFGCSTDKNLNGMIVPLLQLDQTSVYLTRATFKGRHLEDYQDVLHSIRGQWESAEIALSEILKRTSKDDMILITGSLYLVGDILKSLIERSASIHKERIKGLFPEKTMAPFSEFG